MTDLVVGSTAGIPAVVRPLTGGLPRISRISLSDYRAFPSSRVYEWDLGDAGKNFLLYGENGSGKTSLFRALRDLFDTSTKQQTYADYRNIFLPSQAGFISIQLTAGSPSEFRWDYNEEHPKKTAGGPFQAYASRCLFLDYRDLLETNFVHRDKTPNLFKLLVETVLKDLSVTVAGRQRKLGEVHRYMLVGKPSRHTKNTLRWVDSKCSDLSEALGNHLPEVVEEATRILSQLGLDGTVFNLRPATITYNRLARDFADQRIGYTATFFSQSIPKPQLFLNEARLTGLALALYLASARLISAGRPGLLVLDDVLIGLDLSNRLPLLRLLESPDFSDWQIFLFTHDRAWFELAQLQTAQSGAWVSYELQANRLQIPQSGGGELVFESPEIVPSRGIDLFQYYLAKARKALQVPRDERVAGLYARVAFEAKLKSYCSDKSVQVSYKLDSGQLKTSDFLDAIERRLKWDGNYIKAYAHIERVKLFLDGVLNPLAHCHPVTLHPGEVEAAIDAVGKLNFKNEDANHLAEAQRLLSGVPSTDNLREAAVELRTAFEVDLRRLLLRLGGKVTYREDWARLPLRDLWEAAKESMNSAHTTSAPSLVADIESHPKIFLDQWSYSVVASLSKTDFEAAWHALRDPSSSHPKTRLATFT